MYTYFIYTYYITIYNLTYSQYVDKILFNRNNGGNKRITVEAICRCEQLANLRHGNRIR